MHITPWWRNHCLTNLSNFPQGASGNSDKIRAPSEMEISSLVAEEVDPTTSGSQVQEDANHKDERKPMSDVPSERHEKSHQLRDHILSNMINSDRV